MADSLSRRSYSREKEIDDTNDEFCVTDELSTIGQTDDHTVATLNTLEAPDEDNNDERATIGHTDDHAVVIQKLDMPEVPDEDDNVTQMEDERDNTTDGAENVGTRHLDLLSTFSDIAQRQRSCDETGPIITYLDTKELPDDDKHLRQILLTADQYVIRDVLYHYHFPRTRRINKVKGIIRQLVVPKDLRGDVFEVYHTHNGHFGLDKTMLIMSYKLYWQHMYATVQEYIKSCFG